MKPRFVTALILVSIILAPSSWADTKSRKPANGWALTTTRIDGVAVNTILADEKLLKKTVSVMEKENSEIIKGLGGAYGIAFLDAAKTARQAEHCKITSTTYGKIIDYEYTPQSADWKKGSGKIDVITMVETVVEKSIVYPNCDTPSIKREAFKWEIRVGAGGFKVYDKKVPVPDVSDPTYPDYQPFEDAMDFSQEMKTRVESRGFEYKLWAEGEAITVYKVSYADTFDPADLDDPSATVWKWINPKGTKPWDIKYKELYTIDEYSCIDMMFVPLERSEADPIKARIPITMSELRGPPFYCLGRCANPRIINTR